MEEMKMEEMKNGGGGKRNTGLGRKKKQLLLGIGICAAALLALEIRLAHPHYNNWWHTLPGVDLVFGFVGCCVLILLAKKLLAPVLQRSVDYYEARPVEKDPAYKTSCGSASVNTATDKTSVEKATATSEKGGDEKNDG